MRPAGAGMLCGKTIKFMRPERVQPLKTACNFGAVSASHLRGRSVSGANSREIEEESHEESDL